MRITGKDWLFITLIGVVLLLIVAVSGKERTSKVPYDSAHLPFYEIMKKTGSKKEAEKGCEACHNEKAILFPKRHPRKNRCLFCHKMKQEGQ